MMRILHILDHSVPLHSGYVFRTMAILHHQRALGWETFQLTSPKHKLASPPKETVCGYEFYRTPGAAAYWSRLSMLNELALMRTLNRRLNEVVQEIRPDILHAHSPVLNALPALRVAARFGIPLVYEIRAFWEDAGASHGTTRPGSIRYRLSRWLEMLAVRRADAVTTICQGLYDDLVARGSPPDRITVVPNAVDVELFDGECTRQPELAKSLGLADKTVLAFIGSFYAYEGLDLLLRAVPELRASNPDIRLLMVGGGPEEANLRELAEQIGVAEYVIFTGRIPHDDVSSYYDVADIMIYPRQSIRLTELVTPLKPLEAMAHRKIVVASDVGGHRELIRDGKTGYIFRADDVGALVDVVLQVLDQRASWPERVEHGRQFVETERKWSTCVERYRDVYAGVLAARRYNTKARTKIQVAD